MYNRVELVWFILIQFTHMYHNCTPNNSKGETWYYDDDVVVVVVDDDIKLNYRGTWTKILPVSQHREAHTMLENTRWFKYDWDKL